MTTPRIDEIVERLGNDMSWINKPNYKDILAQALTQLVKEVEAVESDLILCTRKGIHTCRKGAIHVPERFCGKLSELTTTPTSDKALQDNK